MLDEELLNEKISNEVTWESIQQRFFKSDYSEQLEEYQ